MGGGVESGRGFLAITETRSASIRPTGLACQVVADLQSVIGGK